jgi:parallel beta-helix repeat protein
MTGSVTRRIAKIAAFTFLLLMQTSLVNIPSFVKTGLAGTVWTVQPGANSIQDFIDIATDGDTILVLSGIYSGGLIIDKSLVIIGENRDNTIIDGESAESVVRISANNVTVEGFAIQHGEVGITIEASMDGVNVLDNNVFFNSYWGIYGDRCGRSVIANSNVSLNGWDGIFLYASEPSVMYNNTLISNGRAGTFLRYTSNNALTGNLMSSNDIGIYILSDNDPMRASSLAKNNVIENNTILNNSCGIKIAHLTPDPTQAQNTVRDNVIAYNSVGLNISGSNGNRIYHNDFIDNSKQVFTNDSANNTWDDGYYSGGNYWSDHNSTDLHWGSGQNETGSDGIFDTSYVLSSNPGEKDNYPFLDEDLWLAPPEIIITSPVNKTYKTDQVGLLFSTNKPLSVIYSLDGQTNVTMTSNPVLTNTFGLSHSIALYANDTLGNEATAVVQFSVTFREDVNVDGIVNIVDVALVAHSYESTPGSERWNPDVDLDNNEVINIVDVAIVARAYGKQM